MATYSIDIPSLRRHFPPQFPVPELLLEFAAQLKSLQVGSIGWFSISSRRMDDYWIENGADLAEQFAFFMHLGEGSQIGFWFPVTPGALPAPIVLVGSEGQLEVLASSLEEFITNLIDGQQTIDELGQNKNIPWEGHRLKPWARERSIPSEAGAAQNTQDLKDWIEKWQQAQGASTDQDPRLREIADTLRHYRRCDAPEWETIDYEALCTANFFALRLRRQGLPELSPEESRKLEPLFRALREEDAQKHSNRGYWLSAYVRIASQAGAVVKRNYLEMPDEKEWAAGLTTRDFLADIAKHPHWPYWIPDGAPTPIDRDLPCHHCGYNLRTRMPDTACPECGTPIEQTLAWNKLSGIDARWYAAVRAGILISFLSPVAASFAVITAYFLPIPGFKTTTAIGLVVMTWWGEQLLAEKRTTGMSKPLDTVDAARVRSLASGVLLLAIVSNALAYFPAISFFLVRPIYMVANMLLNWLIGRLMGDVAQELGEARMAQHIRFLTWIWLGCSALLYAMNLLAGAIRFQLIGWSVLLHQVYQVCSSVLGFIAIVGLVWMVMITIKFYKLLGRCGRVAILPDPAARPSWMPESAFFIRERVKQFISLRDYHGS